MAADQSETDVAAGKSSTSKSTSGEEDTERIDSNDELSILNSGSKQKNGARKKKSRPLSLIWEGFVYRKNGVGKTRSRSWWHCIRDNKKAGSKSCRGRAVVIDGQLEITEGHSHEPDTTESNYIPPHSMLIKDKQDMVMLAAVKAFVSSSDKLLLQTGQPDAPKRHRCNVCNADFALARVMEVHKMLEHQQPAGWTCGECGMQFIHGASFNVHMDVCHGIKPYACDVEGCSMTFCNKAILNLHRLTDHDHRAKGAGAGTAPVADKERNRGRGEKPSFTCQYCPAEYPHLSKLRYHMRIHTGEKPFKCSHCPYSFKTSSQRLEHVKRLHLRVRRHLCDWCGKKFKDPHSLKEHGWTHTGEKPFSCPVCARPFSKRDAMLVHIRQHTGEKPYVCDQCGQAFTVRVSLRTHLKSKHNIVVDTSSFRRQELDPGDNSLPAIGRPKRKDSMKQLSSKAKAKLQMEEGSMGHHPLDPSSHSGRVVMNSLSAAGSDGNTPSFVSLPGSTGHLEPKNEQSSSHHLGAGVPLHHSELFEAGLPMISPGLTLLQMVGGGGGGGAPAVSQGQVFVDSGYPPPPASLSSMGYGGYAVHPTGTK